MNGITIIEEHLCRVVEMEQLVGFGILMTLLFGGTLLLYRGICKYNLVNKKGENIAIVCSILIVIMYAAFWVIQINCYNDTHMEYTVTIDDTVSFNDFHAKYEIVSINGNEYRVVEK